MEEVLALAVRMLAFVIFTPGAVLSAFLLFDGLIIPLGWFAVARIRNKKLKEAKAMFAKKQKQTQELIDELLGVAEPALKAGERALEELEYLAILPDIEEGAVAPFQAAISNLSKELRQSLKVGVGPATLEGVSQLVKLIWDQIFKSEELRRRGWLRKQKHAIAVSEGLANFRSSVEGMRQTKAIYEDASRALGFDAKEHIPDSGWGHATSILVTEQVAKIYASQAGFEVVSHPALSGAQLLSPPADDAEDSISGEWSEVKDVGSAANGRHPMDKLHEEEKSDER